MPANLTDKLTVEIDVDTGKAKKGFADYDSAVSKTASATDKLQGSLAKNIVQGNLLSAAIQKGAGALVSFGKSSVAAAAQTETLKANLQAFFGSAERTETAFKGMREQAARLPLSINQIAAAFSSLGGAGLATADIARTIDMLDDAAQGSSEKFERLAQNFQQITAVGEALRAQLETVFRGVGVAAEISKAFEELTKEGGAFFNGHTVLANTFAGKMDETEKAVTRLKAAFGETIIGDLAKKAFEALGTAANNMASSIERATEAERARKAGSGGTPEQQELAARERLLIVSDNLKTLWTDYYRLKAQGETSAAAAVKNTINGLEEERDSLDAAIGRVLALKKELDELGDAPPPPAAPEPSKEAVEYLDKMRGELDKLTKSEYELALAAFEATKPVGEQATQFEALFAKIEEATNKKDIQKYLDDLHGRLDKLALSEKELLAVELERMGATPGQIADAMLTIDAIDRLTAGAYDAAEEMKKLGESVEDIFMNAPAAGFAEIGKALGESATDTLRAGLVTMSQQVLSQLGPLYLGAGLRRLMDNPYDPVGWAFVAAGGASSMLGGILGSKGGSKKSEEQTVFTYTNADDYYKKKQFARGEAFHNSVLSRPTPFLFGDGAGFSLGIAGEAGEESVMPLKRGPGGMLGVRAYGDGNGRTPVVKVIVINNTGEEARTEEGEDSDGNQVTAVIIGEVKNGISGGSFDGVLSSRYGIRAQGV